MAFGVLTPLFLKIQVSEDAWVCRLVNIFRNLEGAKILRDVSKYLSVDTV
jgi:hypothetical protein